MSGLLTVGVAELFTALVKPALELGLPLVAGGVTTPGGVMPETGGVTGVLEFGAVTALALTTPKLVLVGVTGACKAVLGFVPGRA